MGRDEKYNMALFAPAHTHAHTHVLHENNDGI